MWPSKIQVANVLVFGFVIGANILSSLPSRPFGSTNKDIADSYKTAFTPAGVCLCRGMTSHAKHVFNPCT